MNNDKLIFDEWIIQNSWPCAGGIYVNFGHFKMCVMKKFLIIVAMVTASIYGDHNNRNCSHATMYDFL